jgi:hypothetical protein
MHQDLDFNREPRAGDPIADEIQQIWLSNELMERVKEVAHDIDVRVSHALQVTESSDKS